MGILSISEEFSIATFDYRTVDSKMALHFTNLHPICLVSASSTPVPSVAAQLHLGSETKQRTWRCLHDA